MTHYLLGQALVRVEDWAAAVRFAEAIWPESGLQ